VLADLESSLPSDLLLPFLDLRVVELLDATALQAHEVIVMLAFVQLVDRLARFEVVPGQQARLLELRQHAVDGRKSDIKSFTLQQPVDVFEDSNRLMIRRRGSVALRPALFRSCAVLIGRSGSERSDGPPPSIIAILV
jgi:hypothetical protein